ncbi:trypsin-like peptidase domain-containing protein [Rathayibacter soli]|uniref:trypsin-like peptidase domain-containing protein n=1 Tax=Rathayibacter soli TaxID=3144168 RepID=UPI0027E4794C|nr:trypsin-like peptidase domain-containing protein [Glaciibacter superstes]
MTDTPNDPVNAPEPEAAAGSTDQPEAQTPDTTTDQQQSVPPTADAAPPAPPATPASATSAAAPQSSVPQVSWAAPLSTPQPTAVQPTVPQPTAAQPTSSQPTAAQPTVPQPTVGQPAQQAPVAQQTGQPQPAQPPVAQPPAPYYGNGAFGQPGQPAQPAYASEHPYANQEQPYAQQYSTQPTQPILGAAPATTAAEKQPKKRGVGMLVAALAIGALIGGASGAGVMGIVQASQNGSAKPASSTGAENITVNNASDATPVTAVAAKASPSVVTISVSGSQAAGTGSGVILSADGYVLTNTHVVTLDGETANPTIQVQDNNGHLYTAKLIGTDPVVDLAVIKLNDASGMTPATFADSSKLNVGDRAVAIGAPLGLAGTVTDGIVSALNRSIQIASSAAPKNDQQSQGNGSTDNPFNLWNFDLPGQGGSSQTPNATTGTISLPVIQTDAAINPGNSGGALLNSKGEVIGINVAIASASSSSSSSGQTGSIGVGFAIPSDLASRVSSELIKNGKATHGLLGASVKDASSSASSTTVGATIASVSSGGAAAKAGLQAGDVVTNFNGIPITSSSDITAQVRYLAAGSSAKLTYVRDGKPFTVDVTLGTLAQ